MEQIGGFIDNPQFIESSENKGQKQAIMSTHAGNAYIRRNLWCT